MRLKRTHKVSQTHKAVVVAEAALKAAEDNTAQWAKQEAEAREGGLAASVIEGRTAYVYSTLQKQEKAESEEEPEDTGV